MEKPLATVEHRHRTLCISVSQGLNSKVKKNMSLRSPFNFSSLLLWPEIILIHPFYMCGKPELLI